MGKKLTKNLLTQQQKQQSDQEEQRIDGSFSALTYNLGSFVSSISVRKPGLQPNGNSQLLLRKLSRVHEATRLETRIKRVMAVLQAIRSEPLIYNRDIPRWLEEEGVRKRVERKPYETLRLLETELRRLIQSKLGVITGDWWRVRVPGDVKERAEERKAKNDNQWPWHTARDLHPIHYVDFTDYVKIVVRRDNWEQVFAPLFRDKEIISAKLRELEPIRNAIAHFRDLNEDQQKKLDVYCNDILASLRFH